jgi:hypothetical protein
MRLGLAKYEAVGPDKVLNRTAIIDLVGVEGIAEAQFPAELEIFLLEGLLRLGLGLANYEAAGPDKDRNHRQERGILRR